MPRYAIKQVRALHTIYTDADDLLDAINWARRVMIDQAQHGELFVTKIAARPYESDDRSEARYEETEDDRETERAKGLRQGLFAVESDSDGLEPW